MHSHCCSQSSSENHLAAQVIFVGFPSMCWGPSYPDACPASSPSHRDIPSLRDSFIYMSAFLTSPSKQLRITEGGCQEYQGMGPS